jgi:hypothetical protein
MQLSAPKIALFIDVVRGTATVIWATEVVASRDGCSEIVKPIWGQARVLSEESEHGVLL